MTRLDPTMTPRRTDSPHRRFDVAGRLRAEPALGLLPLRLFLGVTFAYAGLSKLADRSFFDAHNPTSLAGQLAAVRHGSPLSFSLDLVAAHTTLFGVLIAVAEIAVGIATLAGLWGRLAALVGAALALSFYLTISWRTRPYYYGADIVFVFAWLPQLLVGTPVWSLDAWRAGRPDDDPLAADPQRRAVLATGAVGAVVLAAAGLDAAIGGGPGGRRSSAVVEGGSGNLPGDTATSPPSAAAPNSTPSDAAPSGTAGAGGTSVAEASRVPVGGAVPFTDPASGQPAYLVQPTKGDYRAFSAVCTHAGCTVAFLRDQKEFVCPCHGGTYSADTGRVLAGPPPAPLPSIPVRVDNGQIVVADGS